ncbi:hypothetical protein J3U16_07765 [Gilliamella sp. B3023]|uniref:hypothetical protein n=1 Tax=Gilliamella sp. B3023 TaxID=2817987 RepID=UPI00226AAFB2|nr:hypothetical protein [Gilliamella sp. B3023]MCX8675185.1 hypothetical protein [Gilliamella sp. B3023]
MSSPVLALSNKTSNIIHGTPPYLTFDNGQTKSTDTKALSWVSYIENGREVKHNRPPVDNDNNPLSIALPTNLATFADIKTIVPVDTPIDGDKIQSIDFIKLLQAPYNYGRDDDGDVINSGTGKIQMTIVGSTGKNVARTDAIDKCLAPYNIKLKIENSSIQTQYGVPNTAQFSDLDDNYILTVGSSTIYTCFVQPNTLTQNNGVSGQWDSDKSAFLVQNVNDPESNFPATGANDLSFRLIIAGLTSYRQLSYSKSPNNSNVDLEFSAKDDGVPVVKLKGPNSNSPSYKMSFVPTQFTIYADQAKTMPIYRFKLRHWFIPQADSDGLNMVENNYNNAENYCASLPNYRLPIVSDLTNGNIPGWWEGGYPGNGQKKIRQINGGLSSEWGSLKNRGYGSAWTPFAFWTSSPSPSTIPNQHFIVDVTGDVISGTKTQFTQVVCVSP